ncbi:MAG: T9SS type A sorting domain-containing protein, partial [Ignavibacteria bacterium]
AEFVLSQNYPNPFNAASVIKYSIPKLSQVKLNIFNMLGEEIQTLVNEDQSAGVYKISWSAAGLPSEVYFYQLKAGVFIETKKMILMK